jgi:nitrogen regulatory protein P-II 1
MKEIKAIIRPFKLNEVISELSKIKDLPGVTISEIKGFGKSRGLSEQDTKADDIFEFLHKTKIEMVVHDDNVNKIVDVIQKTSHTGNPGDGKIFVLNVEEVVKIRTNERGNDAI